MADNSPDFGSPPFFITDFSLPPPPRPPAAPKMPKSAKPTKPSAAAAKTAAKAPAAKSPATMFVGSVEWNNIDGGGCDTIGVYPTYLAARKAMRAALKKEMDSFLEGYCPDEAAMKDYYACKPGAEEASGMDEFEKEEYPRELNSSGVRTLVKATFQWDCGMGMDNRVFKVEEVEVRR